MTADSVHLRRIAALCLVTAALAFTSEGEVLASEAVGAASITWTRGWEPVEGDAAAAEASAPEAAAGRYEEAAEGLAESLQNTGSPEPAPSQPRAAGHEAAGHEPAGPAGAEDAPMRAVVEVVVALEGTRAPVPDQDVLVHLLRPPHELMGSFAGRTDAEGRAFVQVPALPGVQAFAQVTLGRSYFSEAPLFLGTDEALRTEVLVSRPVDDPAVVQAARMVTLAEPWEGYVAFTQIWSFTTSGPAFVPGALPVEIRLPEGAEGVTVVLGQEHTETLGNRVRYRAPVRPRLGEEDMRPDLVVRFSLKIADPPGRLRAADTMTWEQTLPMDVHDLVFLVPRQSDFRRHEVLDVRLIGQLCASASVPGQVCFREASEEVVGLALREGVGARSLVGGQGRRGDVVRVDTEGWPAASRWTRQVAALSGVFAFLLGFVVFLRTQPPAQKTAADRRHYALYVLDSREAALIRAAEDLARAWRQGELTQAEMERERERLVEQLAVVFRRRRDLLAEAETGTRS